MSTKFGLPQGWDAYDIIDRRTYHHGGYIITLTLYGENGWAVVQEWPLLKYPRAEHRLFDNEIAAVDSFRALRWDAADRKEKIEMREEVKKGREERAKEKVEKARLEKYSTVYADEPLFGAF